MHRDVPRTPTGTLYLIRQGADHGVSAEVCLRGTGLRAEQLVDPAFEVRADQELAVIANLTAALGNPVGLGLAFRRWKGVSPRAYRSLRLAR
ncbi:AraC family transcriptional regulator [Nocardia sp. NBC_00565]|uniref:AraC family transcriptional regulator ligand-binding domain-containing protein n=1 Tax=Nocardia sp. NBC_00565 TaxID=2975993 RepID=UPI002E80E004|nr:AraC family transcriptional regulator ligand-binding domain-containing protein [Nocardia sp. NBC_00565]WUC03418.1 AraC family transcriptional regulator [Nocardia sp. NBC_00565]